jgi:hypothetical protein
MIVGFSVEYLNCIFETIMVAVMFLISLYSYSIFKLSKENKYKWFSYSFLLIAIAFIGRILMNFVVYTRSIRKVVANTVIMTFNHTSASDVLWNYGLFGYRLFLLVGLLGIFLIIVRSCEHKNWLLIFYLAILTALVSMQVPYIFNLTAAVILGLITLQFYQNYSKRPKKTSFGVATAFFIIFLSQVTFIFERFNYSLYVAGNVIQLVGYLLLLSVYIWILRK